MPEIIQGREDFITLLDWLAKNNLTVKAKSFEVSSANEDLIEKEFCALGFSSNRATKKNKNELKLILEKYGKLFARKFQNKQDWDKIYNDFKRMNMLVIDYKRLNPDTMAFYRPFHFSPFENWGVYILANRIVKYFNSIKTSFLKISYLSDELLMSFILFEIFHHEFFHHLVESMATSFEVLHSGFSGHSKPFYLKYLSCDYKKHFGPHEDEPLEEALANAYAYNSFAFISGVQNSFLSYEVKYYQKILEKNWPKEPPGYSSAYKYIKGGRFSGANDLIEHIVGTEYTSEMPKDALTKNLFPNGNYSLFQKPYIPVYLVGKNQDLEFLYELVPAPHETYINLFWPGQINDLNVFLKERRKTDRERLNNQDNQQSLFGNG